MEVTNKKMKYVISSTWEKLAEIRTKAKTLEGLCQAINKEFGDENFCTIDDLKNDKEGFFEKCNDGIIVWMD